MIEPAKVIVGAILTMMSHKGMMMMLIKVTVDRRVHLHDRR